VHHHNNNKYRLIRVSHWRWAVAVAASAMTLGMMLLATIIGVVVALYVSLSAASACQTTITLKDRTQLCAHETKTTIHNKIQAAKKHNKNTINVTVILNYNNTMQATTFKVNTKKISQIDTQGE